MAPAPKRLRTNVTNAGMFFVPEGPSTSHVEESVKTKIRLGEFIELNKLVKSLGDNRTASEASFLIRDGRVELNTRGKPIDRFEKFFDAFIVFMTIRGKHYPEEYPGMLKHFDTVKKLCYQGKLGLEYDRQFRAMKADYPQLSWSQFMPEFVTETAVEGRPVHSFRSKQVFLPRHGSNIAMRMPQNAVRQGTRQQNPCWQFNEGLCAYKSCKFMHTCRKCGASNHGAKYCGKRR